MAIGNLTQICGIESRITDLLELGVKDFGNIVCQVLNLLFFVLEGVLYLGIKLHECVSVISFNKTNAILHWFLQKDVYADV